MNYKDRLKRYDEERKRRNRREKTAGGYTSPLTDPTNPASVFYQHQTNTFYADGSYTSETTTDSGYASRSDASYGSSSYDSGSSSSSYDSGSSCGGSYGE